MFFDPNDSLKLFLNGVYEQFESELVNKEIRPGDVVLDLGANIGYYTLIFARRVGSGGRVYAFEPDPASFAILKTNVALNGYTNVVLVNKAVSDETRSSRLYLSEVNNGDHRIFDSHDGRKSVAVENVRLDDYFKDRDPRVDFIKMDIQGAEWAALQGMAELLGKNRKVKMITEFEPVSLKGFGVEPSDYLKLLCANGFSLYEVNENKKEVLPVSIPYLLETYTHDELQEYTNLLCVRESPELRYR
jgi:FkbM family methyltransferase